MKNKLLTIWDSDKQVKTSKSTTLLWSGYNQGTGFNTILDYVEKNSDEFRSIYMTYIESLGVLKFKGKQLIDHLEIIKGFSFWWMTLLAEKNYLKSESVLNSLRMIALDKKLDIIKPKKVVFVSNNEIIAKAIENCVGSHKINFEWKRHSKKDKKSIKYIYKKIPSFFKAMITLTRHIFSRIWLRKLNNNGLGWKYTKDDAEYHLAEMGDIAYQFHPLYDRIKMLYDLLREKNGPCGFIKLILRDIKKYGTNHKIAKHDLIAMNRMYNQYK